MASMTILLKIRTQRPDAFFQTRTTKKGIGRHRHDKDPGNRDPQGRISEIPLHHPAKREEKLRVPQPLNSRKLRESGSLLGRSQPTIDNGA
jgi:hypothetical protein